MSQIQPQALRERFAASPAEVFEELLQREVGHQAVKFDRDGAILEAEFEGLQRLASMYAKSSVVPKDFIGNVANCFIVVQLAQRMRQNPFVVFQNTHIVHGKPGFDAKFKVALLNTSGLIKGRVRYKVTGTLNGSTASADYSVRAVVTDAATGEEIEGPAITPAIVKDEGWIGKAGSKWKTMPELMYRYRAASWLISAAYPEVGLGVPMVEELVDASGDDAAAQPVRSGRQRPVGDVFGGAYLPSEPEPAPVEQHAQEASDGRRK